MSQSSAEALDDDALFGRILARRAAGEDAGRDLGVLLDRWRRPALYVIRRIQQSYRRGGEEIEVLHGVDLDIPAGDFVALMGPSGSGKTTLLNLIGGLDRPSAGSIVVNGERIDRLSSGELSRWRAANVGFVFQFYNLLPMLSAQRNVELPLLLTDLSAAERRRNAAIALSLVGLADRARANLFWR